MRLMNIGGELTAAAQKKLREAIKKQFPRIPKADLDAIVSRYVKKGYVQRIGQMSGDEFDRFAYAATVAQARHTRTDYDEILEYSREWSDAARRKAALQAVGPEVRRILEGWS